MPVHEILVALLVSALAADPKAVIGRLAGLVSAAVRRLGEHKRE